MAGEDGDHSGVGGQGCFFPKAPQTVPDDCRGRFDAEAGPAELADAVGDLFLGDGDDAARRGGDRLQDLPIADRTGKGDSLGSRWGSVDRRCDGGGSGPVGGVDRGDVLRLDGDQPGQAVEVEIFGTRYPATVRADEPLWDPKNERIRA